MASKSVELIDRGYREIKRRWDRLTRGGVEVKVGPQGERFPSMGTVRSGITSHSALSTNSAVGMSRNGLLCGPPST